MTEKNNATCSICGRAYYMCLSCKDMIRLNPWKMHTDTSEHYKIYQILHGYSTKVYTKKEARIKLQAVDLCDIDSFRENIKSLIKDILKDDEIICSPIVEKNTSRKKKFYRSVETENNTVPTDLCE